jgi:ferrous iron transport protein A
MRLKEGKEGGIFEVEDMNMPLDTERRLQVLGLTEGSTVQVMKNKKRGAMIVKIRGTRFALGEKIAKNILVTETRQNGE